MAHQATQSLTIPIHGLSCGGGGALSAERALTHTPGVRRAYVNPLTEMAYIEFDPAVTGEARLVAAIEGVGLQAGPATHQSR
jgi:cation transport ATPase